MDNEEINKKVQDLAELLTPISDIAVLIGINADELRDEILARNSELSKAYFLGKAKTRLDLRKQEIELARIGSPLAVGMSRDYLIDMDSEEDL